MPHSDVVEMRMMEKGSSHTEHAKNTEGIYFDLTIVMISRPLRSSSQRNQRKATFSSNRHLSDWREISLSAVSASSVWDIFSFGCGYTAL